MSKKPPIKAIKKIIKFCKTKDFISCGNCELSDFCNQNFQDIPSSWDMPKSWKKLKK